MIFGALATAKRITPEIGSAPRQCGRGLIVTLCLLGSNFVPGEVIAQELTGECCHAQPGATLTAAGHGNAKPGAEFRDCTIGCPAMIIVPAGKFMMGSPGIEAGRDGSEGPLHEVTIPGPFAVSKFEVTFAEWDMCVIAAACPRVPDPWGDGTMPAVNVSWIDAARYVGWLSQLTGKTYRLLTEAEWEYAARANATTPYSWGSDPGKGNANCEDCGSPWGGRQTAPVGSFAPNGFGLHDMHGNVWEWVEDTWHPTYDGAPTDGSAWIEGDRNFRIVRGGSWRNDPEFVRAAARFQRITPVRFDTLGFRVARTLSP